MTAARRRTHAIDELLRDSLDGRDPFIGMNKTAPNSMVAGTCVVEQEQKRPAVQAVVTSSVVSRIHDGAVVASGC
jgi:hypothetical protein